jgi:UDP-2,3-diacylglucosamine hydrolase
VSEERVIVVGDAHLGPSNRADEPSFHQFLDAVPDMAPRLLLMGDLFEFWFGYRRAIPRDSFKTMAHIARVVERGVKVEMFGGNHDRWGGLGGGNEGFWARDLGIPFHTDGADMTLAGRTAWVHHGDGLAEASGSAKFMHRVTRNRFMIGLFGALHPDFGFKLTDKLAKVLSASNKTAEAMDASAAKQQRFAESVLQNRPGVQLVVLAHTHRQRCVEVAPGRFYLNAGQWMKERQYAVVEPGRIWTGRWPARP